MKRLSVNHQLQNPREDRHWNFYRCAEWALQAVIDATDD